MTASMRRRVAAVTACLVVLVTGTACSDKTPGAPVAGGSQSASSAPTDTTSTGKPSGSQTAEIDPCSLLTTSEISSLGLKGSGKSGSVAGRKTCQWIIANTEGVLIGVGKTAFAQLSGEATQIGTTHEAKKLAKTEFGGCGIALNLPGTGSVSVVASPAVGQSDESACPNATNVAKIIDPKLP